MGKRGGRNWRNQGRGGRGGNGKNNGWSNSRPASYPEVTKNNESFERYYNEIGLVEPDEKEEFWASLRKELPNSFRFCGSKGHALVVQQRLIDRYIPQIVATKYNGEDVEPPKAMEWFPEKLAWAMTTPKQVVRKFPPFASFQKFLVAETTVGNISRQEIVSMIPPLLMSIEPGMTVLDMCAAPGSKTAQLIEAIHAGEEARIRKVVDALDRASNELDTNGAELELGSLPSGRDDFSDDGRSTGLLVANDVEYRRAQMLVHQVKRLNSPNIIVTNHDATMFPSIKVADAENGRPARYLKFDRILADVPCSGDGTARKNPTIWKDWTPSNGLGLHITQVKILVRALQMLKVGGRVIYSTCSMNPIENEAVVASAIECCGGSERVKLIDCKDELPGLKRRPGLATWPVMDKKDKLWKSWDSLERARESGEPEGTERLVEGMFPPPTGASISLERCMRIYPHLQDTGGFFICVLEKLSEIRARPPSQSARAGKPDEPREPSSNGAEQHATTLGINSPKRSLSVDDDEDDQQRSPKKPRIEIIKPSFHAEATHGRAPDEGGEVTPAEIRNGSDSAIQPVKHQGEPTASAFQKRKTNQPHEEPFKYLTPSHPELQSIARFYSISPRFPRDRFMVRNATGEPVKAIYYTSVLARTILKLNEGKGMKFVHCGVKMFVKQDAQGQDICRWRIQSEGLPIVEPWVGEERIVHLYKRQTLHKMLKEMFPRVAGDSWKELGEIGERVRSMGMGCGVMRVEITEEEDGFKERMVLPMWRSLHSVNLMLPKEERKAMLLRLFDDESELIDHSQLIKNQRREVSETRSASPGSPALQPAPAIAAQSVDEAVSLPTDGETLNVETIAVAEP